MVEQLSSICRCFGLGATLQQDAIKEREDRKTVPLKKRRSYVHHKGSFSLDFYGFHDPNVELYGYKDFSDQESLISSYKKHKWTNDKDSKIVILGATISSIHFASILKQKYGFNNITILENKYSMNIPYNYSPFISKSNHKSTIELVRYYGGKLIPISLNRDCKIIENHYKEIKEVNEYIFNGDNYCKSELIINAINKYVKIHEFIFGTKSKVEKPAKKRSPKANKEENEQNKEKKKENYSFPDQPRNVTQINITFMQFIEKYDLQILKPYFIYNQILLNGFATDLNEIPAFYGLLWNQPSLLRNLIDPLGQQRDNNDLYVLKDGLRALFQNIIDIEDISMKYSVDITSINRYLNDEKHKICIMYNEDEYEKLIECDVLFNGINDISLILPFISDITKEEEIAFGNFKSHTLCITKIEYKYKLISDLELETIPNKDETTDEESEQSIDDDEKNGLILNMDRKTSIMSNKNANTLLSSIKDKGFTFYPSNLSKNGGLFKLENRSKLTDDKDNNKKTKNKDKGDKGKDDKEMETLSFIGYQMMNQEMVTCKDKDFEKLLMINLKDIGFDINNIKIIKQEMIRFCPRWNNDDINNGIPWKVKDALQGKYKNMYYIGESVCYQSIESILKYNMELQGKLNLSQ